jgi:1-aminocyclopropane-1-carboxylate deaminase/D-cysteine desulfhydrase-like pyridoxal-dependent ACC family enzyme
MGRRPLRDPGGLDDGRDPADRLLESMIIDPMYEGKSMVALTDLVRNGDIPAESNVLYAHFGRLDSYGALFAT